MHSRFGVDFNDVRVHTDGNAAQMNKEVNAQAFTYGRDIYFGAGKYNSETSKGRQLLAHELAHVIQQGHARFVNFPSPRQVSDVSLTHASLSIQRVPTDYRRIVIRGREVIRLIRERNAEVYALIERNRLNGMFAEARRDTIGGEDHIWNLAVNYVWTGLATGGRTYELPPTRRASSGARSVVSHRIRIEINPMRMDTDELRARIPDPQQRLEFMTAETLLHECAHALIRIERTFPGSAAHGRIFTDFQRMLNTANSPALGGQKAAVMRAMLVLLGLAHVPFSSTADRSEYLDRQFEFLINEKYTGQMAAGAFGHARSNSQIASTYADVVAEDRIERRGTPFSDRRMWRTYVDQLCRSLYLLYERIDGELSGPPPEIIPAPRYVPAARPVSSPLIESVD